MVDLGLFESREDLTTGAVESGVTTSRTCILGLYFDDRAEMESFTNNSKLMVFPVTHIHEHRGVQHLFAGRDS